MKNFLRSEHGQGFWGTHLDEAKDKHFQVFETKGRVPENA
jgi:hypothetical protein